VGKGASTPSAASIRSCSAGGGLRTHLDQQRRRVFAQRAHRGRHAGLVLHRAQRRAIQQFHRADLQPAQPEHRLAGVFEGGEEHERARLARVVGHGAVGDARDEAERALRPDHQVREDVDRVVEIDEGVEAVARGVLDAVLVLDALRERRVRLGFGRHARQRLQQFGVAAAERGHALAVGGVQHRAVREHHAHRLDRLVAVLRRAAAHAGGVVGGDAADLAGGDRGRVGPDLAAMRRQAGIDVAAHHARAEMHAGGAGRDLAGGEAFADQREHAVGHGLARQAGAGGAEGDRAAVGARGPQDGLHLGLGLDDRDHLRREAVEARVGAVGEAPQGIRHDLPRGQFGPQGQRDLTVPGSSCAAHLVSCLLVRPIWVCILRVEPLTKLASLVRPVFRLIYRKSEVLVRPKDAPGPVRAILVRPRRPTP
jgi:hypothetical protein